MKVKFDNLTYFDLDKDTLHIDVFEQDDDDCGFIRHLREEHDCTVANEYCIIVWATLHELGHYETQFFTDNDPDERELCIRIPTEIAARSQAIQNMYYNLPSEYEATEWAISYEWLHQSQCAWFNRRIDNVRQKIQRLQSRKRRKETK